jgi:hypothetical protein
LRTVGLPVCVVLPVVFVRVAVLMAGAGELVGRCFLWLSRLDAYRCDLIGSVAGIGIGIGIGIGTFTSAATCARCRWSGA